MVHLNHFHSIKYKYLSAFLAGKLLLFSSLEAGVIQFFDPTQTFQNQTIKTNLKTFIADDPMPIKEFLDDWHSEYTPEDGQNIALLDSRFDLGVFWSGFYFGYFYQYDVFIDTNRDFTDLFYSVKNKKDLDDGRVYDLKLEINGIKQYGLQISDCKKVYEDHQHIFSIAGAFYLSYGLDMQDGYIDGYASAKGSKDYEIDAQSSYNYTHNYLYKLDVDNANGYGYGSHLGLSYEDKINSYSIKLLINNLYSRMHWQDLPYSKINIQTKNKSYDKDGYVKYAPSISGLEIYKDYTQKIEPGYKLEAAVILEDSKVIGGIDRKYGENFPYIKVAYMPDSTQIYEIMHESRFGSFGLGFGYKWFKIALSLDDFNDVSSFGLNSSLTYRF
jgi:hypothetical protein